LQIPPSVLQGWHLALLNEAEWLTRKTWIPEYQAIEDLREYIQTEGLRIKKGKYNP